jgi:acyl carrier protein
MICKADIRKILADPNILAGAIDELDDGAELNLDSLAVVWLVHRLEEDHGVQLDPAELGAGPSIDRIHELVGRA